jgi:extradiol dioxygenase family protein
MKVIGLDHLVLNVWNVDVAIEFFRDVLGLEILREPEYRAGKVGFPSVRISKDIIIDLRTVPPEAEFAQDTKNVDHICLRLSPGDLNLLIQQLQAKGISTDNDLGVRWGARGYGESFFLRHPEVGTIELKFDFQGERLRVLGWDARPRPNAV